MPRIAAAVALALLLFAAAGCAQPSQGAMLPLPSFSERALSGLDAEPLKADTAFDLPDGATVALGVSPRIAVDGKGRGFAWDGGDGFRLPAGRVLAAAGGRVIVAVSSGGSGATEAHDASGRVWRLGFAAQAAWASPDGRVVALDDGSALRFVDGATGEAIVTVRAASGAEVAFARDGSALVNAADRLTRLDAKGNVAWTYQPKTDVARHVAVTPDGAALLVASGAPDDTAYAFAADGSKLLWKRQLPYGGAGTWVVSGDGREAVLIGIGDQRQVLRLDTADGRVLAAWSVPQGYVVRGAAFGAEGTLWTALSAPDAATPVARGQAVPGTVAAGGPGALAVQWSAAGKPLRVLAARGDILIGPRAAWIWDWDAASGRAAGLETGGPSR
ncbi:MAG: hypothetical protein IMW98_06760 [Firmicutes bacterium]|nr:hypothetical protein [Bacillota bacterium]